MHRKRTISALTAGMLLTTATGMAAENGDDLPTPVVANLDVSTDSVGTWSTFLAADVGVTESVWLFGGVGRSESPSDELNLDTNTYEGGFSVDVSDSFRFDTSFETWGNEDDISTRELAPGFNWRGDGWRFSVDPALRRITLHAGAPADPNPDPNDPTLPTTPGRGGGNGPPGGGGNGPPGGGGDGTTDPDGDVVAEDFELDDRAISLSAAWDPGESDAWWLRAGGGYHSYTEDPALLRTRDSLERFTVSSLTLAQGFRDWSVWGEAEYRFEDQQSLYLTLARDRSAVDGVKSDTVSLGYLAPVGDQWDFFATAGTTDANGFERTEFLTVGVTWYR